ncbi:MAG: class I SAM-dependent methyltransferase [Patescibacteria group bacterium]|jgi:hypothetical protein
MITNLKNWILENIINFLRKHNYYINKPHFDNPIPDKTYILSHEGYWAQPYPCHGIEFHDQDQLSLCKKLSGFAPEVDRLPQDILDAKKNASFLDMDLEFLYCLIRLVKPKRFVEVGAGWSSLIARDAIARNREEGHVCEHTIIEPYPRTYFKEHFKLADQYINKPVQEVPVNLFHDLGRDDMLFIDSSHVAKYGSDVNYLYFYVIPQVGSGCYIHIHDIFIPRDYSTKWILEENRFFTEQYLVTAFLMYNTKFRIKIAAQYLCQNYRNKLNNLFPRFKPYFSPGSLWIQRC